LRRWGRGGRGWRRGWSQGAQAQAAGRRGDRGELTAGGGVLPAGTRRSGGRPTEAPPPRGGGCTLRAGPFG
jgi:hypothetical protein